MNITKIQTDLLKSLIKGENKTVCGTEITGCIPVSDGYFAALIPKDQFYLSFGDRTQFTGFKDFFKEPEEKDFQISYEAEMIKREKATLQKFITADGKRYAYVNAKYMRYFDKHANYYVYGRKSPVFVMEGKRIVGFILPVNIVEGSD